MQLNSTPYSALLVEDDPLAIDMARVAVAESCPELDLTVLPGVDAALAWLRGGGASNERMPHIILIDLKLPKLDGLALLRTMRNHPAMDDIPIVVYSTEHTAADVVLSYQVGANCFVAKPTDPTQFGDLFREQLAYWMGHPANNISAAAIGDAAGRI